LGIYFWYDAKRLRLDIRYGDRIRGWCTMRRKGIEMNLKIMMVLVLSVIAVFLIYGIMSGNVNFLADYGNKTINSSMTGYY
jgi:hypothetical protein